VRSGPHACRYVVVVRADQPELAEYLRRRLGADPTVEVVVDRRRTERRRGGAGVAADRRRAERRRAPGAGGGAFDMPLVARRCAGAPHAQRKREESAAMEPDKVNIPRESIDRWVVEGQTLFARLMEESEALRRRAETAERDGDKARHEAAALAREVEELRREVEHLRAQQAEAVETFVRLLNHTDQMLRPVNDLLERLKRGPRRVS